MNKSLYCIRNAHNYSSMITTRGVQQINNIKCKWKDLKDIELVVIDKDNKSFSTANGVFKDKPIITIDFLHSPNHLLSQKYDIDYCEKVKMFYDFIRFRKEVSIAYVGHNRFISTIANNQNKIERCHPYLFELVMRDYCDN